MYAVISMKAICHRKAGGEKHKGLVMYAVISMKAICHRKAGGGETYGVSHVRRDQHEGHLPQEGCGRRNIRG